MTHSAILDFCAALIGGAIALIAAFRERRSTAGWLFVAGMALLSCECAFSGMMARSLFPVEASRWENWGLLVQCLVPGVWLLFSLSYARGNYREFLDQSRLLLAAVFLIPIAAAIYCRGDLLAPGAVSLPSGGGWLFALTRAGWLSYMFCLVGAVLVLMQLERTFWASVGTMRWRIKFMLLGLGLLFAVRIYTASQALVLPIQVAGEGRIMPLTGPRSSAATINAAALLLGCLLMLRSLFRKSFDVAVYPSRTGLHKSFTLLVAGLYLLIVGVLAKLVQWLGLASKSFPLSAFLILLAVGGVAVLLLSDRVRLHARRFVSRYLQRPLYDYRTVWRRFTEGTASRVTGIELCQASVKLAADIFQALSVSIRLVDEKQQNLDLAASTSVSLVTSIATAMACAPS